MDATADAVSSASTSTTKVAPVFSCATCSSTFINSSTQRAHMRGEWHIYNLKRKMARLPFVSSHIFKTQVHVTKASEKEPQHHNRCSVCDKDFFGAKKYNAHLSSIMHAQTLQAMAPKLDSHAAAVSEDDDDDDDDDSESDSESDDTDDASEDGSLDGDSTTCLFCDQLSVSSFQNLNHMHKVHGLFIPDQEYVIDLDSFIRYLSFLISSFHECLYCETIKGSPGAVRHHMISKGHCKIDFDSPAKWEEFYDYPEDRERVTLKPESDQYLRLSSGITISHRAQPQPRQPHTSSQISGLSKGSRSLESTDLAEEDTATPGESSLSATPGTHPLSKPLKQVVVRSNDSQGLIGISDIQQRSLRAVEKKMKMMEVRSRMEYQRKVERGGNTQRHIPRTMCKSTRLIVQLDK